jgi:hypothetical protein
MVDDQEASIRKVLAFIGEEFDPKCLAFHENRRYARTASYAQSDTPCDQPPCPSKKDFTAARQKGDTRVTW